MKPVNILHVVMLCQYSALSLTAHVQIILVKYPNKLAI